LLAENAPRCFIVAAPTGTLRPVAIARRAGSHAFLLSTGHDRAVP
jgi:hypothetical protein